MKKHFTYRVVWKRKGLDRKTRRYETERGARRFIRLLGAEPWMAFPDQWPPFSNGPDDYFCCAGYQCDCQGISIRDHFIEAREGMPELEYVLIQSREVSKWPEEGVK